MIDGINIKKRNSTGADPGSFLGGGALVSCSTSTPINHIVFFFAEYQLYWKTAGHLRGGEGVAHPLHPPPGSAPVAIANIINLCIVYTSLYKLCCQETIGGCIQVCQELNSSRSNRTT